MAESVASHKTMNVLETTSLTRKYGYAIQAPSSTSWAISPRRTFGWYRFKSDALKRAEELNQAEDAIKHFSIAAAQSNGTEPVIYFLLGGLLQHEQRTKEAIEAYENYLKLEPQGKSAAAVRSLLTQLRREVQ